MEEIVLLEDQFRIDFLVRGIAERSYPPVFVVEKGTEAYRLILETEHLRLSESNRAEVARQEGVPVLDGLAVVEHLRGEMSPEDEWVLRELVVRISAARQGAVALEENDPDRLRKLGARGEAPLAFVWVPVDELVEGDLKEWALIHTLEAYTHDHPISFMIPPTEKVQAFLRGEDGIGSACTSAD